MRLEILERQGKEYGESGFREFGAEKKMQEVGEREAVEKKNKSEQ